MKILPTLCNDRKFGNILTCSNMEDEYMYFLMVIYFGRERKRRRRDREGGTEREGQRGR